MTHDRKHTVRLIGWSFAGLIVVTPVCLWLLAWLTLRPYRIKEQREAENVVQKFREGYSADRLDKICEAVYGCSLSSSAREDWHSYVQKVRELAGSFQFVKHSKIEVSIEPPGVRAIYVSAFEKGECTEVFDLEDYAEPLKDGNPVRGPLRIVAYHTSINGKPVSPPGRRDDGG